MRNFIMGKISHQLTAVVLASLAFASALYFSVQTVLSNAVCRYYEANPAVTQEKTLDVLSSLQSFVQTKGTAATDTDMLSQWVKQHPLTILQVYRNESLLYDSAMLTSSGLHTHSATHSLSAHESTYPFAFSDGAASVSIMVFPEYNVIQMMNMALLLACSLVFLGIILLGIRTKLRYFTRLEQDVLSIAGGALQNPIHTQGQDELARLAECIDEMRHALVAKIQQEEARQQESYEWVTALSHDLRSPLTMLTGYLEIIRRKSTDPEQQAYIDKACDKATQLKEMSDLLFACFSPNALLNEVCVPLSAERIEEMLSERIVLLSEEGHTVHLHEIAPSRLLAHPDALRRVMDNVFSNLHKYADPQKPIDISTHSENGKYALSIQSASGLTENVRSTGLGLGICQNLMSNMQGNFAAMQREDHFVYRMEWKTIP